jgi:hypothetical protein
MLLKVGLILAFPLLIMGTFRLKDGVVVFDFTNHSENSRVFVPVPLSLVNLGIKMLPDGKLHEANIKLANVEPYLETVSQQLMDLPDVNFVEVKSPREEVLVQKKGNQLIVNVNSDDEQIHISVPIRGIRKVVQNLSEAAE